jgi:hypothetical protein
VDKGAGPAWPAVSPDGKRIAVALCSTDKTNINLEVIVFDREGKELQRSDKIAWAKGHETIPVTAPVTAFWVPGQEKLVLWDRGVSAYYDLTTKSCSKIPGTVCAFRNTPIRPDGKGFVAYFPADGETDRRGFYFIDWDGNERQIKCAEPKDDPPIAPDVLSVMLGDMSMYPMMYSSRWDGSTAEVCWDGARIKLGTDKLTGSLEYFKPAQSDDAKVIQDQVQLAGGGVVRAVELAGRYKDKDPDFNNRVGKYRLEVLKQGRKEPKVIMEETGCFMINPSPDGKKAVVWCSSSAEAEAVLFLIDGGGDVAARVKLSK